jgi:hypothetical protein
MTPAMTNLIESNNATLHAHYSQHGKQCDPGKRLNLIPRPAVKQVKRPAFPDPFAAFDAAVNGKTVYVSGYIRKDGRKVAGYYRRPRATWIGTVQPMYIGLVTDAGTEHTPLLVG